MRLLTPILSIVLTLSTSCGDAASETEPVTDFEAPDAGWEVADSLPQGKALSELSLPEERALCLQELELSDPCAELAGGQSHASVADCEGAVAACMAAPQPDPRILCEELQYRRSRCDVSVGEYLQCVESWTQSLSCVPQASQAGPAGCEVVAERCAHLRPFYQSNASWMLGDDIGWRPDPAIPVDQQVDNDLDLAEPAEGFQLRSRGMEIEAGVDIEYFEVLEVPGAAGEPVYVTGIQIQMTRYSHHGTLYALRPGSSLEPLLVEGARGAGNAGQILFFNADNGSANGPLLERITGSQAPYYEESYGPGVGRVFRGGQKLLIDYHYFNLTDAPVPAGHRVNFVTASAVDHVVRQFQWTHLGIEIPPGGSSTTEGSCAFQHDVRVLGLTRHTHARGLDFQVTFTGGARNGEPAFTSQHWEDDVDHTFPEGPVDMAVGEGFHFLCNFQNPDAFSVGFGERATDEMCILFGLYYSPTELMAPSEDCLLN